MFTALMIDLPPKVFLERCKVATCNPSIALDAIKEFAIKRPETKLTLAEAWDSWLDVMVEGLEYEKLLYKNYRDDLRQQKEDLDKEFIWLGERVIQDESSLNLIKVRLGDYDYDYD